MTPAYQKAAWRNNPQAAAACVSNSCKVALATISLQKQETQRVLDNIKKKFTRNFRNKGPVPVLTASGSTDTEEK